MPKTDAVERKAVIIDDAYARPLASDLQPYLQKIRRLLQDSSELKSWFDQTLGLSGSATQRGYFDPLMADANKRQLMWSKRNECPDRELLSEVLAELVQEMASLLAPLDSIESALTERGWRVVKYAALPKLSDLDGDVSLVVIDYILHDQVPADVDLKVTQSVDFLKELVQRNVSQKGGYHPYVILVSSLPSVKRQHANRFKSDVSLQGAFFRFLRKASIAADVDATIEGIVGSRSEVLAFHSFHLRLMEALHLGVDDILKRLGSLELEDLATLQAGQLHYEGEPLSDYLAWMCGQALGASLQANMPLAEASGRLPAESYRVLLGHIAPTRELPRLFVELSSVRPASGELAKQRKRGRKRELRFGDVFVKGPSRQVTERKADKKYYLVISQTCDLLHGKLSNGELLCVEGNASEVKNTEADLLSATMKQMAEEGRILLRDNDAFLQVEWSPKSLATLPIAKLATERGYKYVGRLNEIYALEAQQNALQNLSRIGVPIKPGYGQFFGGLKLRVFGSRSELVDMAATYESGTVVGILRVDGKGKNAKVKLLFSTEVRIWLKKRIAALRRGAGFPTELQEVSEKLEEWLSEADFHLGCKAAKGGGVLLSKDTWSPAANQNETPEKKPEAIDKLVVDMSDAVIFGPPPARKGLHLRLDLSVLQ